MKRIFLLAVVLLAAASVPAYAFQPEPDPNVEVIVRVAVAEGKVLRVNLANLQQVRTILRFKPVNGDVFFTKVIRKHNGFFRNLNLSELPLGKYVLSVSNGNQLISQVVVIGKDGIRLSALSR